jgi:hypothetical protein
LGVSISPDEVIGRQSELIEVERFLDDVASGPALLELEGDAGIDKSTVWRAAIARAAARGYRVLRCRPSRSETGMSFAGLDDLIGRAWEQVRGDLPMRSRISATSRAASTRRC